MQRWRKQPRIWPKCGDGQQPNRQADCKCPLEPPAVGLGMCPGLHTGLGQQGKEETPYLKAEGLHSGGLSLTSSTMIVITISVSWPMLGLSSTRTVSEMLGWRCRGSPSRSILRVTCNTPVPAREQPQVRHSPFREATNAHGVCARGQGSSTDS